MYSERSILISQCLSWNDVWFSWQIIDEEAAMDASLNPEFDEEMRDYIHDVWESDFCPVATQLLHRIEAHMSNFEPLEHPSWAAVTSSPTCLNCWRMQGKKLWENVANVFLLPNCECVCKLLWLIITDLIIRDGYRCACYSVLHNLWYFSCQLHNYGIKLSSVSGYVDLFSDSSFICHSIH